MAKKKATGLTQEQMVELKKEVKDLLNEVLVKLQNVKEIELTYDYNDYSPTYGTPIELSEEEQQETGDTYKYDDDYNLVKKESKEHLYLASIKETLEEIVEDGAEGMLEQFHTSTC